MRLVFAGTPSAAVPSLDALTDSAHDIVAVISRADAPLGRRRVFTPSAVAARAEALGLSVLKTNRLDAAATQQISALRPDLGVIVAYGGLVREPLLSTPRRGWINLHFSLLPRWRGAAPVQHAIIAGDTETGAAVFQLVPELDAGDVYAMTSRAIGPTDTAGELLDALADDGAELLYGVVDRLAAGTAVPTPQSGEVTHAPKLGIEDARIRWSETAAAVDARIRGVTPEPGAFTEIGSDRLKVHRARIATNATQLAPGCFASAGARILVGTATAPIELVTVQPAGKTAMPAAAWWRGLTTHPGAAG